MHKIEPFILPPEIAFQDDALQSFLENHFNVSNKEIQWRILKRSIDARSRQIKVNLQIEVALGEPLPETPLNYDYQNVQNKASVVIVGAGPAGLFAALRCIELGYKPIVLERGKNVRDRRRDLAAINKEHIVHPDSNYCFGEGGAGTYSDGKLYTRSKKRGDIRRILEILVLHGANPDILVDAHPHIGTNKLPKLVETLRDKIIQCGGEVHFHTRVEDFIIEKGHILGVKDQNNNDYKGIGVVLATGHSARDIFYLCHKKSVRIDMKPFALGVRVEHQQSLIDSIQYHCSPRPEYLPASSYALVEQVKWQGKERGVFSFCMCPGGFIVPSATAPGEIVVNGMSPSRRDSVFSNSGIVVAVEADELKEYQQHGVFAALEFQKAVEKSAWIAGGKTQVAPAQKLQDFVNKKVSSTLLKTSYQPGLSSVSMDDVLPEMIAYRLREGFKGFGKKMRGYLTNEAQIIGVESRTSSPISIPRNREDFEHVEISRLYPCGEGAGYAGGIVSAAMDGERCVEMLIAKYGNGL